MTAIRGAAAAVTGAASGIGRALALELAARGCDLALADRDEAGLQAVAAEIARTGARKITTHGVDVGEPGQIEAFAQSAIAAHANLNIVVNNAGVALMGMFNEVDQAQMEWLVNINFWGVVHGTRAFLPHLSRQREAHIVNLSSIGVQLTPVASGYYSAAKAAIEGLSGALRGEVAPLGISVTVVEPGAFRTDFAGRSLVQSATVIDDYATTAGQRRKENDTMHGNQAGDPAKAGAAIVAAVESSEPPGFLLLGPDALAAYRYIADTRASEIGKWEQLTSGTNLDS